LGRTKQVKTMCERRDGSRGLLEEPNGGKVDWGLGRGGAPEKSGQCRGRGYTIEGIALQRRGTVCKGRYCRQRETIGVQVNQKLVPVRTQQ